MASIVSGEPNTAGIDDELRPPRPQRARNVSVCTEDQRSTRFSELTTASRISKLPPLDVTKVSRDDRRARASRQ